MGMHIFIVFSLFIVFTILVENIEGKVEDINVPEKKCEYFRQAYKQNEFCHLMFSSSTILFMFVYEL